MLNSTIWKGIKALQSSSITGISNRYMTLKTPFVVSRCFSQGWFYSDNTSQTRSIWITKQDSENR
jgi:hypothetical protein